MNSETSGLICESLFSTVGIRDSEYFYGQMLEVKYDNEYSELNEYDSYTCICRTCGNNYRQLVKIRGYGCRVNVPVIGQLLGFRLLSDITKNANIIRQMMAVMLSLTYSFLYHVIGIFKISCSITAVHSKHIYR